MLGIGRSAETKIAVLEERLTSYEVMMKKIDEAIQIMGQTSSSISKMLAVHEEKLENSTKSDDLIVDRIKTIEVKNTEEHSRVIERFESLEEKIDKRIDGVDKKVEEVAKFRWILVGAAVIISFLFSNSNTVIDILTPDQQPVRIERAK